MSEENMKQPKELPDKDLERVSGGGYIQYDGHYCLCQICDEQTFLKHFNEDYNCTCPHYTNMWGVNPNGKSCRDCAGFIME